jgi:hypothetical protein
VFADLDASGELKKIEDFFAAPIIVSHGNNWNRSKQKSFDGISAVIPTYQKSSVLFSPNLGRFF